MTTTNPTPRCAEQVWSHRGPGGWVPGHLEPCPNRARWLATAPGATAATPLCGRHANTGRWARWADTVWEELEPTGHA